MRKLLRSALIFFIISTGAIHWSSAQEILTDQQIKLGELAKTMMLFWVNEQYDSLHQHFDSTMQKQFSVGMMRTFNNNFKVRTGKLKKFGSFKIQKYQQYDVVVLPCEFEKGNKNAVVSFNDQQEISGLFFPPDKSDYEYHAPAYVNKIAFREEEVIIGKGSWKLPGTWTIPAGDSLFPAVVLVHGSGPHDRDEQIGPNQPFRDLAWGLASQGIAVLRYEKKTKYYADTLASMAQLLTLQEETIQDALEAVAFLRNQQQINPAKIVVLGHSLGALAAPRIGQQDGKIAGLIMMAGPARPLEDVIGEQIHYLFALDDTLEPDEKTYIARLERQIQWVKNKKLNINTPADSLPFAWSAAYWMDLKKNDQVQIARKLKQSMLFLQGDRDYQVTLADFKVWQSALGGNKNAEFKLYPKLNHLMQEGEDKSTPEDYEYEGHVEDYVVRDIAEWIKKIK